MSDSIHRHWRTLAMLAPLFLAACGGGDEAAAPAPPAVPAPVAVPAPAPAPPPAPAAPSTVLLRGVVEGRISGDLTIANGDERVTVPASSDAFTFTTPLPLGAAYDVSVVTSPPGHECAAVAPANGRIDAATMVTIRCTRPAIYSVGGTRQGPAPATAQVVNGGAVARFDGDRFTFAGLRHGDAYDVTLRDAPNCTVTRGTGVIAAASVTDVAVTCVLTSIRLQVSGMPASGNGLVVANGFVTSITVPPGTTDLAWPMPAGAPLDLRIWSQPTGVLCFVQDPAITIDAKGVATVPIACFPTTEILGGTLGGLGNAAGLQLTDGIETIDVAPGASGFYFTRGLTRGTPWRLGVVRQPAGLTCSVTPPTYGVFTGTERNLFVGCNPRAVSIGGALIGLTRPGLVLSTSGTVLTPAPGSTRWEVPAVAVATMWQVVFERQPDGQLCGPPLQMETVSRPVTLDISCTDSGTVSTVASLLDTSIGGVAVGRDGTIWVTLPDRHEVWSIPPAGAATRVGGSGVAGLAEGVGSSAQFSTPRGIVVDDAGTVFVADSGNRRIRRLDADGAWSSLPWRGTGAPGDLALDAASGTLYAARLQGLDAAIDRISVDGTDLGPLVVSHPPTGVEPRIALQGSRTLFFGMGAGLARLDLATVAARGTVPLDGSGLSGSYTTFAGNPLVPIRGLVSYAAPAVGGLAVDAAGNLFVASANTHQVFKFAAPVDSGSVQFYYAGTGGIGVLDGPANAAQFASPGPLAIDRNGDLLVGGRKNGAFPALLRRITPPR